MSQFTYERVTARNRKRIAALKQQNMEAEAAAETESETVPESADETNDTHDTPARTEL